MKEKTLLNNKVLYLILMIIIIIFIIPHDSLAKSISSTKITLPYSSTTYTGSAIKPTVTVKNGNKQLKKDKDYTVSYTNNINVGTAKVTIQGKGNYSGKVTKNFSINSKSISNASISLGTSSYTYSGEQRKPSVTVKVGSKKLELNKDYKVSYINNINAGQGKVKIQGLNNYKETVTKTFIIKKKSIANATATLSQTEYLYSGNACQPNVTLKLNSKNLKKNTDYTVTYKNNVKIGKATVTIKGKGNYEGTITKSFNITRIPFKDELLFTTLNYNWRGMDIQQFKNKSSDGQFSIKNGKVTAIYLINKGSKGTIYIPKAATNFSTITLTKLQLVGNNKTLKLGTDYSVKYTKGSTQTTITITGIGIYTGSKTIVCKGN